MPHVTIEPWTTTDLALLTRIQGDPEMTRHLGGPESDEKIADRLRRYISYQNPESRMFKIVVGGKPAGSVGYWERAWRGKIVYEMGWSVLPEFQGHGIARTATELAIERAREERRCGEIHAFPSAQNEPSNRLCRKLGFTLKGEHDFEYPPGHRMKCNDWELVL